jgi:hypothetical protein
MESKMQTRVREVLFDEIITDHLRVRDDGGRHRMRY